MKQNLLISAALLTFISWRCTPVTTEQNSYSTPPAYQIFETYHQIHVLDDGKPFASYLYDSALLKPVLYPVFSSSGIRMQRLYPLKKVEGESYDHPHHVGVFFTYGSDGEVNGNSFWAGQQGQTRIKHVKVTREEVQADKAILGIQAYWIGKDGEHVLTEDRTMIFSGNEKERDIDFSFNLKAGDQDVVFRDTKEGMFAIRVASWLKEDSGTGKYLNSEGDTTEANIWGKRAKWVRLEGNHDGKTVGIIIFNHPSSVNYPTYWHARGYGLFAANPLGQSVFQETRGEETPEPFNYTIPAGENALFKYKMIIYEGHLTPDQIEGKFESYSS